VEDHYGISRFLLRNGETKPRVKNEKKKAGLKQKGTIVNGTQTQAHKRTLTLSVRVSHTLVEKLPSKYDQICPGRQVCNQSLIKPPSLNTFSKMDIIMKPHKTSVLYFWPQLAKRKLREAAEKKERRPTVNRDKLRRWISYYFPIFLLINCHLLHVIPTTPPLD